jgi:hypothetical protein
MAEHEHRTNRAPTEIRAPLEYADSSEWDFSARNNGGSVPRDDCMDASLSGTRMRQDTWLERMTITKKQNRTRDFEAAEQRQREAGDSKTMLESLAFAW